MKMEKINLAKASQLTSPNPVTIVCTKREDGSTNVATVSWWTYVSFNPGTIVYAMSQKSFSGECVRSNKEVIITIPGKEIAAEVMQCGMSSGRDTDKIAKTGLEMQEIPTSEIKVPKHCKVAIHCRLKEYIEVGDHYLYICDVEDVYANEAEEAVFAWKGYGEIAPAVKGN